MFRTLEIVLLDPSPLRLITLKVAKRLQLGSYDWRARKGAIPRPNYGYCVYHGASLAKKLNYERISVIEFGVAGGNGLLALETHAEQASRAFGIGIDVYGFDTAEGLPAPSDYRDLPYHWKAGFFQMEYEALRKKLRTAKLVIGDVREGLQRFLQEYDPAPIAAVMHDLDFYSSTKAALGLFEADEKYILPRVFNYFDDIVGSEIELYNDFTGERLAINEFNAAHAQMKLCPAYHLLCERAVENAIAPSPENFFGRSVSRKVDAL